MTYFGHGVVVWWVFWKGVIASKQVHRLWWLLSAFRFVLDVGVLTERTETSFEGRKREEG